MKIKYVFFVILLLFTSQTFAGKRVKNIFYAQNTLGGFKNAPQSGQEKSRLLKSIGYDGLEGFGYRDFFELRKALDKEGLQMPVNYVSLNFELNGIVENPALEEIKSMIKASEKGSVIYFQLSSKYYKNDHENGDKVVTGLLRELSDFASGYKIRLSAYPHLSTYCETVACSVQIARQVNRKNFGATLNLCHLLKVEGSGGIDQKIKECIPWLFAVNICGADGGDTQKMDWDRLIQPLGQGTFDTYHFLKVLLDNGYKGPIGLQCYNLKGDAFETLSLSLQTWNNYKKRYQEE